jgi:hypothetical protein
MNEKFYDNNGETCLGIPVLKVHALANNSIKHKISKIE